MLSCVENMTSKRIISAASLTIFWYNCYAQFLSGVDRTAIANSGSVRPSVCLAVTLVSHA